MLLELKRLLLPFRRGFALCIVLTCFRQALTVGGGYGFVLLIRTYEHNPAKSALMALGLLISWKLLMAALDQFMGWQFAKNVSGQRQRIAIAQALLSLQDFEKKVVLLDECTSNLDEETEARVFRNIWPLLDGKTVIVVTHRRAAIEDLVDEVVTIQGGRVVTRPAPFDTISFAAQLCPDAAGG
jgi:ABC-type transport system involved in cytochrome bd biosynthesis fused ATPase/permease subunit